MAYDYFSPDGNASASSPVYESDSFIDFIEDEKGKKWQTKIDYSGYHSDGCFRVTHLEVTTKQPNLEYLEEDVLILIDFRENKRVTLECKLEIL